MDGADGTQITSGLQIGSVPDKSWHVALALLSAGAFVPDIGIEALLRPLARAVAVALPLLLMLYRYWRGRDGLGLGLGLGDVKLAAVCGAWLDLATVMAVIELAALLAIGVYVGNAALQRKRLRATAFLPFGLFLTPAIWIGWVGETRYVNWLAAFQAKPRRYRDHSLFRRKPEGFPAITVCCAWGCFRIFVLTARPDGADRLVVAARGPFQRPQTGLGDLPARHLGGDGIADPSQGFTYWRHRCGRR
ncbi:A24 family peptidase [Bradyrhizobium sp. RT3a]|uniref:A24 family peptidase n=1 Tax=unclassified Bradyrhizobium TaxID=2631580 RepID=UPI0033924A47